MEGQLWITGDLLYSLNTANAARTGMEGTWKGVVVVTVIISIFVARLMKTRKICEIAWPCHSVDEVFALVGCYTAYVGCYLPTFRIAYRSVFKGEAVKVGTTGCPQTSVKITNTRCVIQTSAYGISRKTLIRTVGCSAESNWSYEDEEGLYTMRHEDSTRKYA